MTALVRYELHWVSTFDIVPLAPPTSGRYLARENRPFSKPAGSVVGHIFQLLPRGGVCIGMAGRHGCGGSGQTRLGRKVRSWLGQHRRHPAAHGSIPAAYGVRNAGCSTTLHAMYLFKANCKLLILLGKN
nr:hypothetical protein [uncultured Cupriavidus sp.]